MRPRSFGVVNDESAHPDATPRGRARGGPEAAGRPRGGASASAQFTIHHRIGAERGGSQAGHEDRARRLLAAMIARQLAPALPGAGSAGGSGGVRGQSPCLKESASFSAAAKGGK